jgi:RHS repeat-associated protein
VLARYAFDPWGRRAVTSGTDVTGVGFTRHRTHVASALVLAAYRSYDAELARWSSTDPLGDVDGPNRYAYVQNGPIARYDPLGLQLNAGIQNFLTSCINRGDRHVYWKNSPVNPLVRQSEWSEWQGDFSHGCLVNPSPGYKRYAVCRSVQNPFGNGTAGICVCCEYCGK